MSLYERKIRTYYETYLPSRVKAMPDPETFYRRQAAEVARQIRVLETPLVGKDDPGEEFLGKVGRLQTARRQAEEKILGEVLYSLTPEPGTEDREPPMGPVPGVTRVE